MKIHSLLVLGWLATSAVVAHAADFHPPQSAQGTAGVGRTRAEVKAETLRALAAGEVSFGDTAYPRVSAASAATRSRAEVKGETRRALAAGEISFGDNADPAPQPTVGSGPTRIAVRDSLKRAIAAHELHISGAAYPDSGIVTTPRTKVRVKGMALSQASMASQPAATAAP